MKKLRVATYYHTCFGRNDGSPLYYTHALQQLKDIEVVHLQPEGDTSNFGKFDIHLWVDYGEDGLPVDHTWKIPEDGGVSVYLASDTHLGPDYRLGKARDFDYVFFNQPDVPYDPSEKNRYVGYLPHAVEPKAYPKFDIVKKYDVGFIGHLQDVKNYNGFSRTDALDRLFRAFPNFYYGTRNPIDPAYCVFEDAAKKFAQCKIVFNISIKDDINMRVFESMATGSMLLTNKIPNIELLFTDRKHLVLYDTLDQMVELAQYYLDHEEERETIAQNGYEEVIAKHTYTNRVMTMLQVIKETESGYSKDDKENHAI